MSFSPEDIKKLRDKTGAGMMDCKKALDETKDIDKAIDVEPMQLDMDPDADDMEPVGDDDMVPLLDPMDDEALVRDSVNFDDIRAEYDIVPEGKMKDIIMDLQDMSKEDFCSKYPEHADEYENLCDQYLEEVHHDKPEEHEDGEAKEESAPFGEPSQQDMAYEQLINTYEQGGEEALAKEMGMTPEQLSDEIEECARENGLHADDDRDECIQIYIEDVVNNADYEMQYESIEQVEDAIEETADNALVKAMAELRNLAGIN